MPAVQVPCPQCQGCDTVVIHTARSTGDQLVRRRRCQQCEHRWYTLQEPERAIPDDALRWHWKKRQVRVNAKRRQPPSHEQLRGERNHASVLTSANVQDLRQRHQDGASYRELARHFGIATSTVYRIVKRKLWTHL